jgi:DNA replication initiation complex subunit (GINS family)
MVMWERALKKVEEVAGGAEEGTETDARIRAEVKEEEREDGKEEERKEGEGVVGDEEQVEGVVEVTDMNTPTRLNQPQHNLNNIHHLQCLHL